MATYKRTGPDGLDYAFPAKRPLPPPPPRKPEPPTPPYPERPVPPPPPHFEDWAVYPFYPPYQEPIEPVACPPIPGRPVPPPPPVFPPYPMPRPERVDESSKKLAKLSQKAKVLVQMIKDFEQKNKPVILTIGNNSYQFGTENIVDFNGEPAKGMYSKLICGDPIEALDSIDYTTDDSKTRVSLKDPVDLLQSELARVRQEITLVAAALNEEVQEPTSGGGLVPGTEE